MQLNDARVQKHILKEEAAYSMTETKTLRKVESGCCTLPFISFFSKEHPELTAEPRPE